jgi:hypothetical protein
MVRRLLFIALGSGLLLAGPWACGGGSGTGTGGTGGSTTATTSSKSSAVTTTSGGMSGANIGNTCTSDSECGAGLTCILDSANDQVFGGGPAGGYCSLACASDNDCPGADAACLLAGDNGPGVCVKTCTIGPKLMYLNDALDPEKCHGRNDLRCTPVSSATNACLPTCGQDSQCSGGRVCDPRRSVCVDKGMVSTGKPDGAVCDSMATTPECSGICVSFTSGETMCSRSCVLGGDPNDPANTPNCGGPTKGLCAYSPSGNGAGDYGFCALACNKQDECQNPAFWCFPVGGLTGEMGGVPNGFCFGATECPNGEADCTSEKGTACTQTKYGPRCLNAMFPLGTAAPDDAGTGGTGGGGTGGSGTTSTTSSTSAGTGGSGTGGAGTGGAP